MYKIIGADQKEYGPISADQLRQWISEGRVNAQTRVQPEGAAGWKTVAELPEFSGLAPRPSSPPFAITPPPPAFAKGNPMALWSMVVGIFSLVCCQFGGPVSIVLGAIALSQLKQNPHQTGSGFAITGIILGVLALIVVIASIFLFLPQIGPIMQQMQNSLPH